MKRVMWVVLAVLFFCITARAQETPAWEINGGLLVYEGKFERPRIEFSHEWRNCLGHGKFE